eukprot:8173752-Pyramimonas_sp.AAC.1
MPVTSPPVLSPPLRCHPLALLPCYPYARNFTPCIVTPCSPPLLLCQNLAVTGGCGTTRARNLKHVSGDALPATGLDTDMYAVCKELAGESNPLESDKAA